MTLEDAREGICPRTLPLLRRQAALRPGVQQSVTPRRRRTGRRTWGSSARFSCDALYRKVAGFGEKKPGQKSDDITRPIRIDFARVGADGAVGDLRPARPRPPLGWGVIELKQVSVSGRRT
ncbi:MAG: hypothetical protein WDM92_01715 [Caulobacteraceae bacterium]